MRDWTGKRYWIVGASEGLGRAVAMEVSKAGAEVIVSARNEERLEALAKDLPGQAVVVPVDIASRESVEEAAKAAGELDGVIFLAGVYWPMKTTEWRAEEAEAMADINFTGAVRVLGAVMPAFTAKNAGHVVLTGSLSGFRGLPGAIAYGASKAGVMSLAESMKADLRGTNIEVQLSNPGFIKTRLTEKNNFEMPFIMTAEAAAAEMMKQMSRSHFKSSFPFLFSLLFRGSQFLPDWAYYRLFSTAH